jgi:DNA modification methylase
MTGPAFQDDDVTIYQGDCLTVLATLPDASVDAVVTDPPYGLEFMGREWDTFKPASARIRVRVDERTNPADGKSTTATPEAYVAGAPFQRWCEQWARECLRVLKPGGHMLAFGGTRTWHRLAVAVEDAGFEIRDSIAWLYGSGFPKSLDVSKAIDKAAGAERETTGVNSTACPDFPAMCNGHPTANGSLGGGVMRHARPTVAATDDARIWQGWGTALKPAFEPVVVARKPLTGTVAANVLQHGTGALNIDACRIGMGDEYDPTKMQRQSAATAGMAGLGESGYSATHAQPTYNASGRWPANVVLDEDQAAALDQQAGVLTSGKQLPSHTRHQQRMGASGIYGKSADPSSDALTETYGDTGGASRFFPTFRYEPKAPGYERPTDEDGTGHPTVKPLDLIRWLVRLVTPPGGLVLDPFLGSGTTAEACVIEGFRCIGIEQDEASVRRSVQRL